MLLPLLIILSVGPARALSTFPAEVEAELGMPCAPTCDLCHASTSGGGAPSQPFGQAMLDRGMSSSLGSLAAAIAAMEADAVDSDADGVVDTEQLALGENPNPDGTDYCAGGLEGPSYGCRKDPTGPGWGMLGMLAGLGLARRRRKGLGAPQASERG